MSTLVVDASAALMLVLGERGAPDVREHLRTVTVAAGRILVPPLFWLEAINVLATRYRYDPATIVEAVYELEQVGLLTAEVGRPGVLAVIDATARFGLTAYDAAYLVLAESAGGSLLTADARLAAAAGDRALLVGSEGGVAEPPAGYAAEVSWAAWKGAAAYLAELRSAT
jgi:predicted nucleic acid-binding protein